MADNSDPSGDSSGFFDGFWSVADKFAAPLAQAYVVGQNGVPGSENGMIQERLRFNALNGSGPVDPAAALALAQGATVEADRWFMQPLPGLGVLQLGELDRRVA